MEEHLGYQMVAVALGSASGNTGQLETGMLVYVQYGVIGGQHGVSFFLFFFILFPIFFFNLWLAIYDRPYDRSFFVFLHNSRQCPHSQPGLVPDGLLRTREVPKST